MHQTLPIFDFSRHIRAAEKLHLRPTQINTTILIDDFLRFKTELTPPSRVCSVCTSVQGRRNYL